MDFQTAFERVAKAAGRHARRRGLRVQPDAVLRRNVLKGLARNLTEYGRPYCPCREVVGDEGKDRPNICPCRTHREEVDRRGECECGLYVAEDYGDQGSSKEGKAQGNGIYH